MYLATWALELNPDVVKMTTKKSHLNVACVFSLEAVNILALLCVFSLFTKLSSLVWSIRCSVYFLHLHHCAFL